MPEVLAYLNYRREVLLRLNRSVVMWVSEWVVQEMIRRAPDFWAFRRHLFEFSPARATLERLATRILDGAGGMYADAGGLADNITLLQALLADMNDKNMAKSSLAAGLQRELGVLLWRAGQWSAASKTLEEAAAIFGDLGDRRGEAATLQSLATVRRAQGDHGAALAIEQQLGDQAAAALPMTTNQPLHVLVVVSRPIAQRSLSSTKDRPMKRSARSLGRRSMPCAMGCARC